MIIDKIEALANTLGIDTNVPARAVPHLGYLYSRPSFILGRVEESLGVKRAGNLYERLERCQKACALTQQEEA